MKIRYYYLISLFVGILIATTNDYFKEKDVSVIVKKHIRGKNYSEVLLVENDDFGVFDIAVTPAIYHSLKDGERTVFRLSESDINQTLGKDILYFLIPIILTSGVSLLLLMGIILSADFRKIFFE